MAETVQYYLERMVPELEDLEQKRLFNKVIDLDEYCLLSFVNL